MSYIVFRIKWSEWDVHEWCLVMDMLFPVHLSFSWMFLNNWIYIIYILQMRWYNSYQSNCAIYDGQTSKVLHVYIWQLFICDRLALLNLGLPVLLLSNIWFVYYNVIILYISIVMDIFICVLIKYK